MNLNHLLVFHAVCCEGGVSRAADRLLVSQPAVSKLLRDFEREVGTPLFDRLPRGMRLTKAGAALSPFAQRIFALAEEAENALHELDQLDRSTLSVGASTTIGIYLLPDYFVEIRKKHPKITLKLQIGSSDVLGMKLRSGEIDIALSEAEIEGEDFATSVFRRDELVPIGARGHPLARKRSVSPERLCHEPFVVRETGSGTKSLVERRMAELGLKISPVLSLGSTESIKRAVATGIGVAIVSRLSIDLELQARRIEIIRVPGLRISRPLYRTVVRGAYMGRALKMFIEYLGRQ
jgi:DNA-binding transcriptional LysR family regulator